MLALWAVAGGEGDDACGGDGDADGGGKGEVDCGGSGNADGGGGPPGCGGNGGGDVTTQEPSSELETESKLSASALMHPRMR